MNKLLVVVVVLVFVAVAGCGGGGGSPAGPILPPIGGTAVTAPLSQTVPTTEIRALGRGTPMKLRLNRAGTALRDFDCFFLSFFQEAGDNWIVCQTAGDLVVGAGDSGSPLLTSDGRIAGALAAGFSGGGFFGGPADLKLFLARPIDDMLAIRRQTITAGSGGSASATGGNVTLQVTTTTGVSATTTFNLLQPSYLIGGVSQQLLVRMRQRGRGNILNRFRIASGPPRRLARTQSVMVDPQPGHSVSINLITGDLMTGGAIGTLTYRAGSTIYALGHALERRGPRSAPVSLAFMDAMVAGATDAFKVAHPIGEPIGSLVADRNAGVIIELGAVASAAETIAKVKVGSRPRIRYQHKVATDQLPFDFKDLVVMSLVAPVEFERDREGGGNATVTLTVERPGAAAQIETFSVSDDEFLFSELDFQLFSRIFPAGSGDIVTRVSMEIDVDP